MELLNILLLSEIASLMPKKMAGIEEWISKLVSVIVLLITGIYRNPNNLLWILNCIKLYTVKKH
ncbi:MAG: hypothetical protein SV062_08800 [Thermodesulfobacteriota bacterium]|nr:hypothetical protein [Thermodesulfobacteriota bacterium]